MEADSGLHFLLKISTQLSDTEVCKNAEANGIRLSALSQYYQDGTIPDSLAHTYLINYSSLPEDILEEAIRRIYRSVR